MLERLIVDREAHAAIHAVLVDAARVGSSIDPAAADALRKRLHHHG